MYTFFVFVFIRSCRGLITRHDQRNSLGLVGVWHSGPKVSHISFGTLTNNQEKHPTRTCMDIDVAARYIQWIFDQPKELCINNLSIDPMQERK